jgi:type I restriction enzyme S subunit
VARKFFLLAGKQTTNLASINKTSLGNLSVALPRVAEQRAIAEALSDVDGLLGGLDRLIAKKRDLKQAAMQQLLTGQTRLPGFQGEWEVTRLDELGTWKGGMTPSMRNPDYWHGGTVPWISSGDVKSVFLNHTSFSITELAVKRGVTTMLPPNSILLVTRSGILRKHLPVAMNMVPMAINQDIKALLPNEAFCPAYLLHALLGHGDQILKQCMKAGTTVESVELRWLKAFSIPIPPFPEQIAVAEVLTDMDAELAALEQRREKTRALKQAMMQELLTGRVRLVQAPPNVIPFPSAPVKTAQSRHNWQIDEAVIIGALAGLFGTEAWPLPRKRRVKLTYLLHRHARCSTEAYLKKAAGPYNPKSKYQGPEGIALKNSYVREHHNGTYAGFVAGPKLSQAEAYFEEWYPGAKDWLEQFRFAKTDELELLATVDMAMEDLRRDGRLVAVDTVKKLIHDHPEWEAKLDREIFSDDNIARAIQKCGALF